MEITAMNELVRIRGKKLKVAVLVLAITACGSAPARAEFGVRAFDQQIVTSVGDSLTQAGGHPYEITTEVDLNNHVDPGGSGGHVPDADPKDIIVSLPPGLIGNPTVAAQCTQSELAGVGNTQGFPECPLDSVVGTISTKQEFSGFDWPVTVPIYNMVPTFDEPATFGFSVVQTPILIDGNVKNGGDFSVVLKSTNIPAALPLDGFTLTFWGVPADGSHNNQRCDLGGFGFEGYAVNPNEHRQTQECPGERGTPEGSNGSSRQQTPFVTLPVSCPAPGVGLRTVITADSWQNPGVFTEGTLFSHLPPGYPLAPEEWGSQEGTTGCDIVPFNPSIAVTPTTSRADTPAGLNIELSLPQDGLLDVNGIATSDVKKAVVVLPAGLSVSPSAASGLEACSIAQIGLDNGNPPSCPEASKLGAVEIVTPVQSEPLHGFIYLAKQGENPFGTLLSLYLTAEGHGVVLKLPGRVDIDPQTGQLTSTFDNSPQLPFSHLRIAFNGGSRAPLVMPHECGTYSTVGRFTPWSGTAAVEAGSSFQITSGPGGGPCPNSGAAFSPGFQAGTTNVQAGAFSPFTLAFFRQDGEQQLGELETKMPPGLLGTLSNVALCPEPQASTGDCSADSQIGTMTVGAGAGATPVYVYGGKVFLTTGYKGAQYGLSIVQEAVAGPFDLGRVVVRAQVNVDPHTAALTISSDPLPTALQGIPLDLRVVSVSIDRQNFTFNPTSCSPMRIDATLTSGQGAIEATGSPFQVTNCAVLGFKPKFTVSTSGHTSRKNGASLDAKVVYPGGPFQANIAKVKVDLPKQLPSRLTTLQKACPAQTFDSDPSKCQRASIVGIAKANTPVLPVQLTGPVYFVSHGGEAFPNLIVVLQGYGVRVDLVGDTFINKAGITSSTFKQVPDVPISSFELFLPQGSNSALAANGNLCKSKLRMPTLFVAQNGMTIKQSTVIKVTGCSAKASKAGKAKRARDATKARKAGNHQRHGSGYKSGHGNRRSK